MLSALHSAVDDVLSSFLQRDDRPSRQISYFPLILSSLVGLLCVVISYRRASQWQPVRDFISLSKIPHPKDNLLLGNLSLNSPHQHRLFLKYAQQLGGVFAVRILWIQVVIVVDVRYINLILGTKESLSKGLEPDKSDELMSHRKGHRTLFSADTNSQWWSLIRKGTRGAFTPNNIRNAFPHVVHINQHVINNLLKWGPDAAVDLNNITMRMAMDVTGLAGFNKDFGTCQTLDDANTDETFEVLKAGMLEAYRRATNPARFLMLWDKEVRQGSNLFKTFREKMVELKDEVKARGPVQDDDVSIAAHLLRLKDPATGQPLPDDLLAAEFGVYFAAGIESAGNAMSWTLYLISQHPEVEARLAEELDEAGFLVTSERPNPPQIQWADLSKLRYVEWVSKEAMRCLPVASTGVTRKTKRAMHLGGYLVPAGTYVVCPFYAAHRFEANWPDLEHPDKFDPERWAEPGMEQLPGNDLNHRSGVKRFLPFSMGPRQCIGQSLARVMHDTGVAMLLSQFHFKLAAKMGGTEGVEKGEINRLTLQPGLGLWMNCIPRATAAA